MHAGSVGNVAWHTPFTQAPPPAFSRQSCPVVQVATAEQ